MKMADIKVGMKLKSTQGPSRRIYTVTELTPEGFKYSCPAYYQKIGYSGGVPEFGMIWGGEWFGLNGESLLEEV